MLGTREIALFHHTGCGMATCTTHGVRVKVREALPGLNASSNTTAGLKAASNSGAKTTSVSDPTSSENTVNEVDAIGAVDQIDFLEFSDLESSVRDDVAWLRSHPLLLRETVVTGWVYEVETGQVSWCFLVGGGDGELIDCWVAADSTDRLKNTEGMKCIENTEALSCMQER
jgi:carbonic anhydrase